ncbi:Thaumatin-like protein [Mycena sanguinolenta]|uniref:Thaumatin-like protein n=1 Tax=Mycena sanguinolenta TaxID=230812 RepID=A0A8H6YMD5_9AGAR|nr:Thaumatin-like protein [Mycena sanguinolenta]
MYSSLQRADDLTMRPVGPQPRTQVKWSPSRMTGMVAFGDAVTAISPSTQGQTRVLMAGATGGLQCDVNTGTGVPPATLAEFNFNGGGSDFYDVSLVDGYNLPMRIDNNVGCGIASCPVDLGPNCPAAQKGPFDSTGFPVGCKSACEVDVANGQGANSPNCCTGSHNTQPTCLASGVTNYQYFKSNCPNSYAFPFDEPSGTALWTCPTSKNAAYTITFCPPP